MDQEKQLGELQPIGGTQIAPAVGIAALALDFALKYHGINTVRDHALYQQYKLEGRNMRELRLDMVFETAMQMEMYMMAASERIAKIAVEAVLDTHEDKDGADVSPQETG